MDKESKVRLFKNHIVQHRIACAEGLIGVDSDRLQLNNKTFNHIFENEEVKEEKKTEYLWKGGEKGEKIAEYLWKYGKKEGVNFISLFPLPKERA